MDENKVAQIISAAEREYRPDAEYDQPPGGYVTEARDWLEDDAPWYQIAAVAFALQAEDEGETEDILT